ncbi:hypothetical protein [Virgisporangium aurantiacum]|uniref:Uncharacterized protein n=1 Tax=Virgisporangium aurantiacum TaxID=175570 RepID=A0A8J4E832_9ACTN|nr:hypothetical protein [Virgisporangium aurantiacum]GIJ64828.1 hypothetical protein Vau01_123440 [Virgisporangium aurantiacum]
MTEVTFTSWARLEPQMSDPTLTPGISAEIADPLWLLGRQWQLGEFTGEDAGTPAWVEVHGETGPVRRVRLGDASAAWQAYQPDAVPLEALVEAEPPPGYGSGADLAARAGLRLVRELADRGVAAATVAALPAAYPLTMPSAGVALAEARFLAVASRRAPDGLALGRALRDSMGAGPIRGETLPPTLAHLNATSAFVQSAHAWLDWLETIADLRRSGGGGTPPGWRADRFDQTFAIAAPQASGTTMVLRAPEYRGGTLDWWAFDASTEAGPATAGGNAVPLRLDVLASPLGFPGAPVARYWEIEDAAVDVSAATVAPHETANLLLLEYVFAYGGDALLVPIEAPVGTRLAVRAAVLVDVFGDRVLAERSSITDAAAGRSRFALFGCTGDEDAVLLAPAIGHGMESEPIEDVVLLRDEMANLGWAVEAVAPDAAGAPADWRMLLPAPDPSQPPALPPAIADDRPALRWRLMRRPPGHWHPLVPQATGDRLSTYAVGSVALGTGGMTPPPRSVAVREIAASGLREEELAREGRRLVRAVQVARWVDGGIHVWTARSTLPGRGEGHSGVRFDDVLPEQPLAAGD